MDKGCKCSFPHLLIKFRRGFLLHVIYKRRRMSHLTTFFTFYILLCSVLAQLQRSRSKERYAHDKFNGIRDDGTSNYTCDELARWLGTEKHYSNDKKPILFAMLKEKECSKEPFANWIGLNWGMAANKKVTFFNYEKIENRHQKCEISDNVAVVYLSNFSINNNFSHFLHSLLRLFCALVDSRILAWDPKLLKFIKTTEYTIWLDEFFKVSETKLKWFDAFGANLRELRKVPHNSCVSSKHAIYGSGCVKLLPPEKWFGYPGCRAKDMLPAFGYFFRHHFLATNEKGLLIVDEGSNMRKIDSGIRVSFAVRDVGTETGRRLISNLGQVQSLLRRTQHVKTSTENITFEHLDVPSTIRYMAGVHIFVSVHGAGMTNMFFMNPGSAVLEIIPFPLCNCRSPDYFYGTGGYYHGSAIAQSIKHYHYCVAEKDVTWHTKPAYKEQGTKCSWKYLHAVDTMTLDPSRFVSLMRNIEKDLVALGTIELTEPIINMSPHANG